MVYGLYALSSGTGSLAPVARDARPSTRELDLSTGRPGPRDFTVLSVLFVRSRTARCKTDGPPHPTPRVVTVAKRPSCRGGTCERMVVICPAWQGASGATK